MASGSGKNQDDNETKEPVDSLRQREESNAAAAAATEPPPSAPQFEITPEEEEVHGPPEAGGQNPSAATATAAATEQKGEETVSLFWAAWGSAGGKPPLPPRPPSFSSAGGPSAAFDLKDVFNELMLECQRERSVETDQKAEAEGTPRQQNEQVDSPALWPKKGKKPLWRKAILPATMASGSGKNQDNTETKEPVQESNAASAATEPPPLAPQCEIIEEEVHGPPEAGGRNPSAATATAAGAKQKGEETMSLFRQDSAGSKPPVPPWPASIPRARGANIDMKDLVNEQKRNEDTTCGVHISDRRRRINPRRIFLITVLIFFSYLPTAIGFQRYDLDAVANELRAPRYQMQIQQALAAQEAQEAARLKVLWRTAAVVLFLAFLFGNLMAGANNGQEEVMPPEAPAPEIGRGSDLLIVVLILFALVMVTVAVRLVLRGRL